MLLPSLVLLLSLFLPKFQSNRHIISQIFERASIYNRDLKGNIQKPTLVKTNHKPSHSTYIYKVPLGIPFKKLKILNDQIGLFKDGLNKHTELDFKDGLMFLRVFNQNLPERIDYHATIEMDYQLESTDRPDIQGNGVPQLRQDTALSWRGNDSIWQDQSNQVDYHVPGTTEPQIIEAAPDRLKSRG